MSGSKKTEAAFGSWNNGRQRVFCISHSMQRAQEAVRARSQAKLFVGPVSHCRTRNFAAGANVKLRFWAGCRSIEGDHDFLVFGADLETGRFEAWPAEP